MGNNTGRVTRKSWRCVMKENTFIATAMVNWPYSLLWGWGWRAGLYKYSPNISAGLIDLDTQWQEGLQASGLKDVSNQKTEMLVWQFWLSINQNFSLKVKRAKLSFRIYLIRTSHLFFTAHLKANGHINIKLNNMKMQCSLVKASWIVDMSDGAI